MTDERKKLLPKHYAELFHVRRSARYHFRRRRFFERLAHWTDALTMVCGSGAAIAFFKTNTVLAGDFAMAVAVMSACNIVFGFKKNAMIHHDCARRYLNLENALSTEDLTPKLLKEVRSKTLEISAEEPSVLRILDLECHNELLKAEGREQELYFKVRWWHKLYSSFFDFGVSSIRTFQEIEEIKKTRKK